MKSAICSDAWRITGNHRFSKVFAFAYESFGGKWVRSKGEISEDGNEIVLKARPYHSSIMTIVLKRK